MAYDLRSETYDLRLSPSSPYSLRSSAAISVLINHLAYLLYRLLPLRLIAHYVNRQIVTPNIVGLRGQFQHLYQRLGAVVAHQVFRVVQAAQ